MKKAVLATLLLFSISVVAGEVTTEFNVKGMICASCQAKAEKALKKTNGVTAATVNLEKGEAKVTYDDQKTNPEQIKKVIKNAGFAAEEKKS